jgi:hexosaminidase
LRFDPASAEVAHLLRQQLTPATGFSLLSGNLTDDVGDAIALTVDGRIGPSAYELEANTEGVRISGGDVAGLFHGTQTLRQLLPPQIFRRTTVSDVDWYVPGIEIADRPRFAWRGMLLDVSRHFFGLEMVLKLIDLLALHRMNVLHLHLTDDQGWRIEIKRYPRLTDIGSWRARSMIGSSQDARRFGAKYDETPHSGFFTQDDIREIVAYAAERFITVIPEIDVPGHSQAAIAAYPELGNTGTRLPVRTDWGVNTHVLNVSDETIAFYKGVLEEVLTLFPGVFIHVGGDEVPKDEWQASPLAQERIRELGLAGEDELQSWFITQLSDFLTDRGRRPVGWDEILEGGLPRGAMVMSWQGESGGIAAARLGHDVVMTPDPVLYLYHHQSDPAVEPPGVPPIVDLRSVYAYEPVPTEMTEADATHVLGAQCQMWTEFVVSPRQLQEMVFPRLCAFSEVVWAERKDSFAAFERRLGSHKERLKALDVSVFEGRPLS